MIERQLTEENPGFVNLVTMVETVWVLDRVYGLSNHEVAKAGERILRADGSLHRNDGSQGRGRVFLGRAHRASAP